MGLGETIRLTFSLAERGGVQLSFLKVRIVIIMWHDGDFYDQDAIIVMQAIFSSERNAKTTRLRRTEGSTGFLVFEVLMHRALLKLEYRWRGWRALLPDQAGWT